MNRAASSLADRFWGKVPERSFDPKACWEWRGGVDRFGYGRINVGGGRIDKAHRVAFQLTTGPIPEGLWVLHHCDNPPCVRPSHLYAGTPAQNTADMVRRGRHLAGRERTSAALRGRPRPLREACRQGHPWTPDNTARDVDGYRRCRSCQRVQNAKYNRRHETPVADGHAPHVTEAGR